MTGSAISDEELMEVLLSHLSRVRGFCIALAGSVSDGDDLVQEAYESGLNNLHTFTAGREELHQKSLAWLMQIARNRFLNQRRYQQVRSRHLHLVSGAEEQVLDGVVLAELRQETRQILEAIARLAEEQKAVLLLAAQGFSYAEVSQVMDIPQGTVMSRLSRARANLKQLLLQAENGENGLAAKG